MAAVTTGFSAGLDYYQRGITPPDWDAQQALYLERWAWASGGMFEAMLQRNRDLRAIHAAHPGVYQNTKLLWKHHEAVMDFWTGVIYQGALSTDGQSLPDDVPNAIPVDPQTTDEERDAALMLALSELWAAWNWQGQMSLRPMYASVLGDCLTELADDPDRRFAYPQIVWPGYVRDIELDYVGNVRAYTLDYRVQERNADGSAGTTYRYRKEVDKEAFRHYRDDRLSETVPNPYGFVPAIWDRHRIGAPGSVRGRNATDGTRQAITHLNSLLGHALDFQHKAFWVPTLIAGAGRGTDSTVDLSGPGETDLSNLYRWAKVPAGAQLLQPTFDLGQTMEMVTVIREGVLAENPEASFYQQMREMQQVTAPGAERLMGDVKNRVDLARAGYDAQTVKLFQMAIAIIGMRVRDTGPLGYARAGSPRLNRRRQAFLPYDLESYDRGELDMTILPRPIVTPTQTERMEAEMLRLQTIAAKENLQTVEGLVEAGVEKDVAQRWIAERREQDGALWPDMPDEDAA